MEAKAALLLLLVLPGTLASPLMLPFQEMAYNDADFYQSLQCAKSCTGSRKFNYEAGKTYQYDYAVSTATSMHGASADVAKIEVKAKVNIHVLSACDLGLSLSDVRIFQSDSTRQGMLSVDDWRFKSSLEGNTLRFSFQDGRVEELCPSNDEMPMALNFKRGVLSAFQNSMSQHDRDEELREIDVAGECPTKYTPAQKGWKTSQFEKVKDLLGCTDRHDYRTSLQSTPFRLPDAIQSLPLLKGNHKCSQTLTREGILQSATCVESLVFRPFSKKESGARTETTQTLSYTTMYSGSNMFEEPVSQRASLVFDHKKSQGTSDQTLWSAKEKLSELCRFSVQGISAEVPGLFTDLIYLMRGLDSQQINDIADRVQRGQICTDNKEKAKKFFLDALPMVGTSSSVEVMVNMLLTGEITGVGKDLWISSLHFVQHPTREMIIQLKKLLLSDTFRMQSLLPVSSLVNNFCAGWSSNCLTSQEVVDVVNILDDILGRDCQSADQEVVMMTLRAAGNLGFSNNLAPTLDTCAKLSSNAMIIRVLAVQAYRGTTCDVNRESLMKLFRDTNEDSELRIAAYLGVMECWNENILEQVKRTLESEAVNQVGSFVWTHLTNLLESSSPHKQALREILEDETLQREFDLDHRKYSRNYEVSMFSERLGIGAEGEGNLVWSSKSFLPRSAMVNLTVDILGHSVNLLEVGGRMEGLELLLQNYFGSSGIFKGGEKPKDGSSSKCVKQQKMDDMKKKFAVEKDALAATMYMRMFGNELGFHHFSEKDLAALKDKFNVNDILSTLAKGHDISFTQSAMFMDSSVTVPTIAGMALTLSVNGTASVELQANGKVDMRKMSLQKVEAFFNVQPSGAVQISGMMSLNFGETRTGLKMTTTLHTSSAVSGSLDLTNGQVLSIDFDTPKKSMEILDVKSEFFLVYNEVEKKQDMLKDKVKKVACSSERVLNVLGYELCGAVSFVNASTKETAPYFPFTGPLAMSVSLVKKDAPKGFKLTGKQIQNKATSIGQLSIDTPGSTTNRAISIGYFVDMQAKSLEAELKSPWKTMVATGSYTVSPVTRSLNALVLCDGGEYKLVMKVDKDDRKGRIIWSPSLEISRPQDSRLLAKAPEKFSVDGTVEIDDKFTDIAVNLKMASGSKPNPTDITANYINKENQKTLSGSVTLNKKDIYSTTLQLRSQIVGKKLVTGKLEPTILISTPGGKPFELTGNIDFREERMLRSNIEIKMDKTLKEPVKLETKITKSVKKGVLTRYRGQVKLSSQFAQVKTRGFIIVPVEDSTKKAPLLSTKINLDYTLPIVKDRSLRRNRVILTSKIVDKSSKSMTKYNGNINLESRNYPDASFVSDFELIHKKYYTKTEMTLKMGPKAKGSKDKNEGLKLSSTVKHRLDTSSAEIEYDIQVLYPEKKIEYQVTGKHEHDLAKKFKLETYANIIFAKGRQVELRLFGEDRGKKNNMDGYGNLELRFPAFRVGDKVYSSRTYKIVTTLLQDPDNKEYTHTVNLQINDDVKHSLVTNFKKSRNEFFDLSSKLQVDGDLPFTLTFTLARQPEMDNMAMKFLINNNVYSAEMRSEGQALNYRKGTWDITWPERRIKGHIEGDRRKEGEKALNFNVLWDANRDETQKIDVQVHGMVENERDQAKHSSLFSVTTPFEGYKVFKYQKSMELSNNLIKDGLQVIWQKMENELGYNMSLVLPASLEKLELTLGIVTPHESLRKANIRILHKFDGSKYLSTNMNGVYNNDDISMKLLIANSGNAITKNLEGSLAIDSSLPKCRNVLLKLTHTDDGRVYDTEVQYRRNDAEYKAKLDATYFRVHYQMQTDSTVRITLPTEERPIVLRWKHTNSLTNLNSSLTMDWDKGYDAKLVVGGKFNKAEKDYALDIDISGPWREFRDFELQYRHNSMYGSKGSIFSRINKDPRITSRVTYSCGNFPYTLVLEQSWPGQGSNQIRENSLVLDASVDKNYNNGWSAEVRLATPWEDFSNIDVKGSVSNPSKSEWGFNSVISMGVRKDIAIDFTVDTDGWRKIDGSIKTPYGEMRSMNIGYSKTDKDYKSKLHFELPNTDIKRLEINLEASEQRRGYTTDAKISYDQDKEIALKFKGRYNKNRFPDNTKFDLDLTTPFDILPSLDVKGHLDKSKNKWIGTLDLKSASEALEYLNVKLEHDKDDTSCHNDFEIASSVFETVTAGMHFDWGDLAGANITLLAPSVGRSMLGFKKKSKSWTDFQNKVFAEVNGYDLDMDVGLKHDDKLTKAWLTYNYPGSDHSYIQTSVHRIGDSVMDFDVGGFLQVGKDSRPYNISMQYAMVEHKFAIGTTLETPYTKPLSYLLNRETQSDGTFTQRTYTKFGRKYELDTFTSFKLEPESVDFKYTQSQKYDGKDFSFATTFIGTSTQKGHDGTFEGSYNKEWIKVRFNRKNGLSVQKPESVDVMIFSPYEDFTDIGMHATVQYKSRKQDGLTGSITVEYMDDKEAVLTFDVSNIDDPSNVYLNADLVLPIAEYKKNTLTYKQFSQRDRMWGEVEIITGKREHLNGKWDLKNQREFVIQLNGPLEQLKSLEVVGKFDEQEQRLNGDASLTLTLDPRPARLGFDVKYNGQPASLVLTLRSPYKNIRQADLRVEHVGQSWKQFITKATLNSDEIGAITSETSWRFENVKNMEGVTELSSSIKNMENLRLAFNTKEVKDSQVSHADVGWSKEEKISVDNTWLYNDNGYNMRKLSTSIDVSTPFDELKVAHAKLSHTLEPELFDVGVTLHHNGRTYVDADLDYKYGRRNKGYQGNVEIRSPRPMAMSLSATGDKGVFDGKINMNWDKNSPEANIEIVTTMADRSGPSNADKSFKIKAIHPVRVMGVEGTYKQSDNELLSSGLITWNELEGNTFSYDLGYINRTTLYSGMYEGHLKLGVPQRSIKLQASHSNTGIIVTSSNAIMWDADKDETKKVTMTSTVERKNGMKRVGLNINVPYINKQLNLGVTAKEGYGSTLMDSKAEISYSSDPRKMIVVTSVISNSEIGSNENYNYTVDLGFEHAITDTNIQVKSHIAHVDKSCSLGGIFTFLTARREKKTVALWAKMDNTNRNMEVQVVTPIKNVGVVGEVNDFNNRHYMQLTSFEDGKQALKLDMTIDPRRKTSSIVFNYDKDEPSKMLTLESRMMSDRALQVAVNSQDGRETTSESMINVRLNTSDILHTRIQWRPMIARELHTFMGTKVTAFTYAANEVFGQAVDSVGSEVKAKYLLVSDEFRSEMGQVFQLMDKEMLSLSEQFETLRREFRRFYQRNDLHIKDMTEQVKIVFDELCDQIKDLVQNYRSYYTTITTATNNFLENMKNYPIASKYAAIVQELTQGLKSLREVLDETLNELTKELNEFSEVSYRKYLEISREIDRKLNSYTKSLHELPIYRRMLEQQAELGKAAGEWSHTYNQAYIMSQEILQNQFHDVMARSEFQHMHAVASEFHRQISQFNLETSLDMAVRRVIDLSKNLILMELAKLKDKMVDLDKSRVIVYDPERGELQFELHLPVHLKSLVEPPKLKLDKYFKDLQQYAQFKLPSSNATLSDMYYKYVPSMEPSTWVPPFGASAYLLGSQHYITFDKHHFDYLSSCSSVLARDMLNDSFTVAVNYERRALSNGIKSLCFTIEDSMTFEISRNYKVEVNNRETEMPVVTDKVKIVREGDFVRVEYIGGLEVLCNPKLDIYKVSVSGWHHGHLSGLLGQYNNEKIDDHVTDQMTDAFEVNRWSCNSRNIAAKPDPNNSGNDLCSELFEASSSKFRPCFTQEDPAPFLRMCQVYMTTMTENEAVYKVTEQYRYVCRDHGVFIGSLKEYIPCNNDDAFTVEGTDPIYQSADIVFVIDDHMSSMLMPASLASMVTELNNVLTSAGMTNNRFGLVSYGGAQDEVLVRTINGQHFGEASLFLKAAETLKRNGGESADIVEAVRQAMDYPYRPGVAKVLVIGPASPCHVGLLEQNLAYRLQATGFSVHVLQEQFYVNTKDTNMPRKIDIFGVDSKKVFTNLNSNDDIIAIGDIGMRKPSDYCMHMALTTNGSVFDTVNLGDVTRERKFIQTFAQRIGWETKLPACQKCQCVAESRRTECTPCNGNTLYSYLPWQPLSLSETIGSLHDIGHEVKTYLGYA